MESKNVVSSLVTVGGTFTGAITSRIIADKLTGTIKKAEIKHGLLAVSAVLGACLLDRKDEGQALLQDVAIGCAATQVNDLVKELVAKDEKNEIKSPFFKTGLGNPWDEEVNFLSGDSDIDDADIEFEEPIELNEITFRK